MPKNNKAGLSRRDFLTTTAAGECQGGFNQHGLGRSLVFGRIAGRHAAESVLGRVSNYLASNQVVGSSNLSGRANLSKG